MLRFTRLRLKNWKNFLGFDVLLQDRTFLIGPNASGKSNFLDVFRFLRDIAHEEGGFQRAVNERGGVSKIRSLWARKSPVVFIETDIGDKNNPSRWRYRLAFSQTPQRRPVVKEEAVFKEGRQLFHRTEEEPEIERTQTFLEQVSKHRDFLELVRFLQSVHYQHIVPQLVRQKEQYRYYGSGPDPYGFDFLAQISDTPKKERERRLRAIHRILLQVIPGLESIEFYLDGRGIPHLRAKFQNWRYRGAWQDEHDLSDGTLRLMGFLWSLLDRKTRVLLLEEPELSLHAYVVSRLPYLLAETQRDAPKQAIVSTHAVEMFRDKGARNVSLQEILLLIPAKEGTEVKIAKDFEEIRLLVESGLSPADAIEDLTAPPELKQASHFEFS